MAVASVDCENLVISPAGERRDSTPGVAGVGVTSEPSCKSLTRLSCMALLIPIGCFGGSLTFSAANWCVKHGSRKRWRGGRYGPERVRGSLYM